MSFAGHVFDMIRRNKESHEAITMRRQRMREAQERMSAMDRTMVDPQ